VLPLGFFISNLPASICLRHPSQKERREKKSCAPAASARTRDGVPFDVTLEYMIEKTASRRRTGNNKRAFACRGHAVIHRQKIFNFVRIQTPRGAAPVKMESLLRDFLQCAVDFKSVGAIICRGESN
jgi:hypothetical protein